MAEQDPLKVRVTIAFSEAARRAVNAHHGVPGLATRADLQAWVEGCVDAALEDLGDEDERREKEATPCTHSK